MVGRPPSEIYDGGSSIRDPSGQYEERLAQGCTGLKTGIVLSLALPLFRLVGTPWSLYTTFVNVVVGTVEGKLRRLGGSNVVGGHVTAGNASDSWRDRRRRPSRPPHRLVGGLRWMLGAVAHNR